MKLKHLFIFLLASVILASCSDSDKNETLPEDIVAQGTDGDNIKWVLQKSGTLTIDGNGQMKDHTRSADNGKSSAPWANYLSNDVKKIVISQSITSIGASAFAGCSALQSLTIPESVTSIGASAFAGCSALVSFTIPDSVTSVGENAFDKEDEPTFENIVTQGTDGADIKWVLQEDGTLTVYGQGKMQNYEEVNSTTTAPWGKYLNEDVKKIVISNAITSIGNNAFVGCSSATQITIAKSVTSIGRRAFIGCGALIDLTIPESVTSIDEYAFNSCRSLREITIPSSITEIKQGVFHNCFMLTKLTIPESVTTIEKGAFGFCESLTELTIPNSVTSIGEHAFVCCYSLNKLTISKSVTEIGQYAFGECHNLKTIYSYCPMSIYPSDKFMFNDIKDADAIMYVAASDLQAYKAAQATYWDKMNIKISDAPAP